MSDLKRNPSTIAEQSDIAHGAFHLANNPDLYEIQRSNNFEFIVTDIDNILRAGADGSETRARIASAQEYLRMAVSSAFVPHYEQNIITVKRGNTEIKYAGEMTFGTGTLTCIDYIGADTVDILMAWQNLSGNINTEKVGLVEDYKKTCYLIEYSPDGQEVRRFVIEGCWISAISEDDFDSENNDKRKISCTIVYDKGYVDTSSL